jgi:zinc protease
MLISVKILPMAFLLMQAPADTTTTAFEVGGVRVIHRPLSANEVVAVNLYLLGGSAQLNAQNAGIEAMLLRASEFGTQAYPGRATRMELARTGSRISIQTEPDWTMIGFRGIRSEFDSTWSVFADRVMRPAVEPNYVDVVRKRMLIAARSVENNADVMIRRLADSVAFAGHPYQFDPEGTEASLQAITRDALRNYLETQMVTSRMLLVVVGNIGRPEIEAAIQRTFAKLPRGNYVWSLPPAWSASKPTLTIVEQSTPTNYILGYFPGPQSNDKDYPALRIATRIMGGIAYGRIRRDGLSYAAYSPFLQRGASAGGVYVSTTRPDTAIGVFNRAITLLQEEFIPQTSLREFYDNLTTEYYSMNESSDDQADFLARYELLHGDWRKSGNYLRDLRQIGGSDIKRVVRRYMKNIQYVYIGDSERAPAEKMGIRN